MERREDAVQSALAVAAAEDRPGALAETNHAFRVEQHVSVLRLFPLEAESRSDRDRPIALHRCVHVPSSSPGHGYGGFM